MNKHLTTQWVKSEAQRLGFSFCGISAATFLETEARQLNDWLNTKKNGDMQYMENYFDKRVDPRLLVDGAKSIISLAYNYYTDYTPLDDNAPKISKYALGVDYHHVIRKKLREFIDSMKETIGDVNGRAFVDSAPVMDKAWAQRSGIGWMGKNTNIINKKQGSFFFLAELMLDIELDYDMPSKDYCGTCTRCIDACPTEAIVAPYVVDGSRCISYFTIEFKKELPSNMVDKFDNWMFGCDICQDVCPWNKFSVLHDEKEFEPHPDLVNFSKQDWIEITEDVFQKLFGKSAIKRTKFTGLKRNINFLNQKNTS